MAPVESAKTSPTSRTGSSERVGHSCVSNQLTVCPGSSRSSSLKPSFCTPWAMSGSWGRSTVVSRPRSASERTSKWSGWRCVITTKSGAGMPFLSTVRSGHEETAPPSNGSSSTGSTRRTASRVSRSSVAWPINVQRTLARYVRGGQTPRPGGVGLLPAVMEGTGTGLGREESIALCGEDEVALGQAVDLVRPDLHHHLPPGELQVRVVALLLGHGADAVDESQRALEVPQLVHLAQVMVVHGLPTRLELAEQLRERLGTERRHASAAGYALLVRKRHGGRSVALRARCQQPSRPVGAALLRRDALVHDHYSSPRTATMLKSPFSVSSTASSMGRQQTEQSST